LDEVRTEHARLKPQIDHSLAAADDLRDAIMAVYRRSLGHPLAQAPYAAWVNTPDGQAAPRP